MGAGRGSIGVIRVLPYFTEFILSTLFLTMNGYKTVEIAYIAKIINKT